MRVVIFGGTGLLGSSIRNNLEKKKISCFVSSLKKKSDFKSNLLSEKKIFNFLKKVKPDVIINCSGETDVNLCNKNFEEAYKSNVKTIKNIVFAAEKLKKNTYLIHISSDQVYDSIKPSEEDDVSISNNYGASKFLGEIEARRLNNSLVLRTNFFGKSNSVNRLSYTDYIISNLSKKKKIYVPSNVYFNPIHIHHLNEIIFVLIRKQIKGTFNVGSRNSISKYTFAKKVAKKFKLNLEYLKSYKSIYSKHKRPLSTFMSTKKLKKKKIIEIPEIQSGIKMI